VRIGAFALESFPAMELVLEDLSDHAVRVRGQRVQIEGLKQQCGRLQRFLLRVEKQQADTTRLSLRVKGLRVRMVARCTNVNFCIQC
jgi:hypothetical protein